MLGAKVRFCWNLSPVCKLKDIAGVHLMGMKASRRLSSSVTFISSGKSRLLVISDVFVISA